MPNRELIRPIEIENLRDLQAALRDMDGESHKKLRGVFNAAAETVAGGARRRVPVETGRARATLKPLSQQRLAKVVGGSTRAAYYPWLDFGGRVGRSRSVERKFVEGGRYLYPSWAANRKGVLEHLADAIGELATDAGLTVT